MRPLRVGSTGVSLDSSRRDSLQQRSDLLVPDPLPPLAGGSAGPDLLGEALPDEVVQDLDGADLQAVEGVHAREVAAESGAARRVDLPAVLRPAELAGALDVEPADRVPADAGV